MSGNSAICPLCQKPFNRRNKGQDEILEALACYYEQVSKKIEAIIHCQGKIKVGRDNQKIFAVLF